MTTARVYALGDTVEVADYAGPPHNSGVCSVMLNSLPGGESKGYGACTLPARHQGSQHVAATGLPDRSVVGIAPREDAHEPIVEQPTPEVVAERLRVVEEEVVALRTRRDELLRQAMEARGDRDRLEQEYAEFRREVVRVAMDTARRHDWCSVVRDALRDMGLGDLLTQKYTVHVEVRATREVTVQVEAESPEEAWRAVDRMSESELADAYEEHTGEAFSRTVMDDDEWTHQSHDARTSGVEEVEQ